MDRIYVAALQKIPGIGNARIKKLMAFFGDAQQAWQAKPSDLACCKILDEPTCRTFLMLRAKLDIVKIANQWERQGISLCREGDACYPALLQNIFDPPVLLYYIGNLPMSKQLIAVVGARKSSVYGRNAAHMFGSELASVGVCVVSGAARGIDTAAHKGALDKGTTIAVLGCGVDVSYPPENRQLLGQIATRGGAVLSEYPPGTAPHPAFFPARNRIISGLSKGVVVVEAAERSGALITAEQALDEGRDVFAVPGSIFSDSSKGVHRLIKQGAKLVDNVNDILEEYDWGRHAGPPAVQLSAEESAVYGKMDFEQPVSLEELAVTTRLPVSTISYLLLQLELRGLVTAQGACCYIRTKGGS